MPYTDPVIAAAPSAQPGAVVITADGAPITQPMTDAEAQAMLSLSRYDFFDTLQNTCWDGLLTYRLQYVLRRQKEGDLDVQPFNEPEEVLETAALLMAAMDRAGVKYRVRDRQA